MYQISSLPQTHIKIWKVKANLETKTFSSFHYFKINRFIVRGLWMNRLPHFPESLGYLSTRNPGLIWKIIHPCMVLFRSWERKTFLPLYTQGHQRLSQPPWGHSRGRHWGSSPAWPRGRWGELQGRTRTEVGFYLSLLKMIICYSCFRRASS